jgi:hypothetical protein
MTQPADVGNQTPAKLCLVIGPMKTDEDRKLQKRLSNLVGKLLSEFRVETPDIPQQGGIMRQIMARLDQADMVVADITGSNPSVMYELGIRHCIGLPTVMVRGKVEGVENTQEKDPVAFDLQHYRYIEVDFSKSAEEQTALAAALQASLKGSELGNTAPQIAENPVTEFYKDTPLIEASPAAGLALGYYVNLVKRTARALADSKCAVFLLDDERKKQVGALNAQEIARLSLHVYIPSKIQDMSTSHADSFRIHMGAVNVEVTAPGRRVGTFYHRATDSLIDIPTTLSALEETLNRRLPNNQGNFDSPEARFILARELDRFRGVITRLIDKQTDEPDRVLTFLKGVLFDELPKF